MVAALRAPRRRRSGARRARRRRRCSAAASRSAVRDGVRRPRVELDVTTLYDDAVRLPGGPRLALRRADGDRRPFLLVHGLSSNARLWDGVGRRLAAAGHQVVAVDQRGHGRSEQVADGYTPRSAPPTSRRCAASWASPATARRWSPASPGAATSSVDLAAGTAASRRRARRRRVDLARRALPDLRGVLGRARAAGAAGRDRSPSSRDRFRALIPTSAGGRRRARWPTSEAPTGTLRPG